METTVPANATAGSMNNLARPSTSSSVSLSQSLNVHAPTFLSSGEAKQPWGDVPPDEDIEPTQPNSLSQSPILAAATQPSQLSAPQSPPSPSPANQPRHSPVPTQNRFNALDYVDNMALNENQDENDNQDPDGDDRMGRGHMSHDEYKAKIQWRHDSAFTIPLDPETCNILKFTPHKPWTTRTKGKFGSREQQRRLVVGTITKLLNQSQSDLQIVDGRVLDRYLPSRNVFSFVIYFETYALADECARKIRQKGVPQVDDYSPVMTTYDSTGWPEDWDGERVNDYLLSYRIPGIRHVKPLNGQHDVKPNGHQIAIPREYDAMLGDVDPPEESRFDTLRWFSIEEKTQKSCNNCWSHGHRRSQCSSQARCFRCLDPVGVCNKTCNSGKGSRCGFCGSDRHISPHCSQYIRKRVLKIFPRSLPPPSEPAEPEPAPHQPQPARAPPVRPQPVPQQPVPQSPDPHPAFMALLLTFMNIVTTMLGGNPQLAHLTQQCQELLASHQSQPQHQQQQQQEPQPQPHATATATTIATTTATTTTTTAAAATTTTTTTSATATITTYG